MPQPMLMTPQQSRPIFGNGFNKWNHQEHSLILFGLCSRPRPPIQECADTMAPRLTWIAFICLQWRPDYFLSRHTVYSHSKVSRVDLTMTPSSCNWAHGPNKHQKDPAAPIGHQIPSAFSMPTFSPHFSPMAPQPLGRQKSGKNTKPFLRHAWNPWNV